MKRCHCCQRKYPLWLFKDLPQGWYSRDGKNHCCKFCNIKNPIRYDKKKVGPFMKCIKKELTLKERIKEFLNA